MPVKQSKILVHAHVFYQDMWPELDQRLESLVGYEYELHVSLVQDDESLRQDILSKHPEAQFHLVENRGFDILPFVQLIQGLNLDDYSFVVKIHTKRNTVRCYLNNIKLEGADWRNESLRFLASSQHFQACMAHMEQVPSCGLIASRRLTAMIRKECLPVTAQGLQQFLQEHELPAIPKARFAAGTMFLCRAELLKELSFISCDDFEHEIKHDGLFAHLVERYFGYLVSYHQMHIADPNTKGLALVHYYYDKIFLGTIWPFLYYPKYSKKGHWRLKICKIPLPFWLTDIFFSNKKPED